MLLQILLFCLLPLQCGVEEHSTALYGWWHLRSHSWKMCPAIQPGHLHVGFRSASQEPHFPHGKTEAQRGCGICPGLEAIRGEVGFQGDLGSPNIVLTVKQRRPLSLFPSATVQQG